MAAGNISVYDKVILLTGASGLIGREAARVLLSGGARMILAGHSRSRLDAMVEELAGQFSQNEFLPLELELTDEKSIENCIARSMEGFGRIDVLINNAAIDAKFDSSRKSNINRNSFEHYPFDLIRKSVEVNTLGTIRITQHVCRVMLEQGRGNIINVASVYSLIAPNQNLYDFGEEKMHKPVDYVASKSFMPNFTRYIATLYGAKNIRCNAVAPHGIFDGHEEAFLSNFARLSPLGRMGNVSELNGVFLFLCSDASSYITGTTLLVDGGWAAW